MACTRITAGPKRNEDEEAGPNRSVLGSRDGFTRRVHQSRARAARATKVDRVNAEGDIERWTSNDEAVTTIEGRWRGMEEREEEVGMSNKQQLNIVVTSGVLRVA